MLGATPGWEPKPLIQLHTAYQTVQQMHIICTVFTRPVASQWFMSGGISDLRTAQSSDEVLPVCRPNPPRVAARHREIRC